MKARFLFLCLFIALGCSKDEEYEKTAVPVQIETGQINLSKQIDDFTLRCVAGIYKEGEKLEQIELIPDFTNDNNLSFPLMLTPGDYQVLFFMDYTPIGKKGDHFYITSDLKAVTFNPQLDYIGNTSTRDIYFTKGEIRVSNTLDAECSLEPLQTPVGKFQLQATDLSEYLSLVEKGEKPPLSDMMVKVLYQGFLPSTFNTEKGLAVDAQTGVSFFSTPDTAKKETVILAGDCIFLNGQESAVDLMVEIYDKKEQLINRSIVQQIPLYKGRLNTYEGMFLTTRNNPGGIKIDKNYEGEFHVEF